MLQSMSLILALGTGAQPQLSVPAAIAALGRDEDVERSVQRLRAAGKPGVWALHGAAKAARGPERGRLFEGIGRVGGSEAEWALLGELRGASDVEGAVGAVRGLVHLDDPRVASHLVRHAAAREQVLRDAISEGLAKYGLSDAQTEALMKHEREEAREIAVRVLASKGSPAQRSGAISAAIGDPSPKVRRAAIALVVAAEDRGQVFTLAEMARSPDEALAIDCVRAIERLGGWNAPGLLATVLAHASTQPAVRVEAASALRKLGRPGVAALVKASSEVADPAAIHDIAARGLEGEELDAVIDLLEDAAHREASAAVLRRVGPPASQRALARQAQALPELHAAIAAFLSASKGTPAPAIAGN